MSYFNDKYADLEKILLDYLASNKRGQNVLNLPLSLANRAQKNLWAKKPWCDFAVDVSVNLVNNSYTFPSDFGRIIEMWPDLTGNGVPQYWYYEGNSLVNGYKIRDSFTKASGHSWSISFNYPQASDMRMTYQKVLEDMTGSGDEYLAFPLNLVLLECQKIYQREKGNTKDLAAIEGTFDTEFKDFCNCHQWINYDSSSILRDRMGNQVVVEAYSLDGLNVGRGSGSIMKNSFLRM